MASISTRSGAARSAIETKLYSGQGRALLALLGLDRTVAAGEGPAQFEGTATRRMGRAVAAQGKDIGHGLDADAEGSAEPWAPEAKANLSLKVRSANLAPLLDLKPGDTLAQNIGLSSRVALAGNSLTFDDLDSSIAGSRLRGRLAVTLGEEKEIEGEIGARPARAGAGLCTGAWRGRT